MNPMYWDAGSKNSKFYTGMYELISAFFQLEILKLF